MTMIITRPCQKNETMFARRKRKRKPEIIINNPTRNLTSAYGIQRLNQLREEDYIYFRAIKFYDGAIYDLPILNIKRSIKLVVGRTDKQLNLQLTFFYYHYYNIQSLKIFISCYSTGHRLYDGFIALQWKSGVQ